MRYLKVSFKTEVGNVREESLMPYTESSSVEKQESNSVEVCCCYDVHHMPGTQSFRGAIFMKTLLLSFSMEALKPGLDYIEHNAPSP